MPNEDIGALIDWFEDATICDRRLLTIDSHLLIDARSYYIVSELIGGKKYRIGVDNTVAGALLRAREWRLS